jgi:CBS domain containing-hemolysin-like protein
VLKSIPSIAWSFRLLLLLARLLIYLQFLCVFSFITLVGARPQTTNQLSPQAGISPAAAASSSQQQPAYCTRL